MAGKKCLMLEVALFLFLMAHEMKRHSLLNLIYEKLCITSFSANVCAELTDPKNSEAFAQVQASSSFWIFLTQVFLSLPALISCLYMGSLSDLTNRKVPLMISSLAEIFCTLLLIVLSNWKSSSLWLAPISCGISGLGGNIIVTIYSTISYVSDLTSKESRTTRISLLEGMIGTGAIIGPFASAVVIAFFSQKYVFVAVAFVYTVQFLYIIYGVESRKPERSTGVDYTSSCSGVCRLQPFRDVYVTLTRKRKGFNRLYIACSIYISATAVIVSFGIMDILYLFVKDKPLEWNYNNYTTFVSVMFIARTFGGLVLLPLFKKLTDAYDATVIAVGVVIKMLGCILLGLTTNTAMTFAIIALDCTYTFIMAGCKGLLSKLVSPDEQGKTFSVMASFDNLSILIASLSYNTVYPLTRSIFNGLLFECSASLLLPAFIVACTMRVLQKKQPITNPNEESCPVAKFSQFNGYNILSNNQPH